MSLSSLSNPSPPSSSHLVPTVQKERQKVVVGKSALVAPPSLGSLGVAPVDVVLHFVVVVAPEVAPKGRVGIGPQLRAEHFDKFLLYLKKKKKSCHGEEQKQIDRPNEQTKSIV